MRQSRALLYVGLVLAFIGIVGMIATGTLVSIDSAGEAGRRRFEPGFGPRDFRPRFDRPDDTSRDGDRDGDRQNGGGTTDTAGFTSDGQRIYYTGVGGNGPIAIEWDPGFGLGGMMGRRGRRGFVPMGCVRCHREDGRGGPLGMMGAGVNVPDIRYKTLTSEREENGETVEPWDDEDIARAVRDGVEPNGDRLNPLMPRWEMDDTDMSDTIDYLKELD